MQTRAGNFSRRYWRINLFCGWDTVKPSLFRNDSRVSTQWYSYFYFVDPRLDMIEGLNKLVQTASNSTLKPLHEYGLGNKSGIDPYVKAAILLMNWDWESMQDTI
jgi:hypothetical protein